MKREELARQAAPESLIESFGRHRDEFEGASHEHPAEAEIVRRETYRGHEIVVRTRYSIEVDGRPVTGHVAVTNDGQVHYHPLPNYSFSSAMDLVKQLIEVFPEDFPGPGDSPGSESYPEPEGEPESGHAHEGGS